MTIEEFIARCHSSPLPQHPMARVRVLARELAEGITYSLWAAQIPLPQYLTDDAHYINRYFVERWDGQPPDFSILQSLGYLSPGQQHHFEITRVAFDLLEKSIMSAIQVFISYRREESSAFALLVDSSLREVGVDVFLDTESLLYGDNWRKTIQHNIAQREYFLLLVGTTTLNSEIIRWEIRQAVTHQSVIIPIVHNGYQQILRSGEAEQSEILKWLNGKHTLYVEKEDPNQYRQTINYLLRYFETISQTI